MRQKVGSGASKDTHPRCKLSESIQIDLVDVQFTCGNKVGNEEGWFKNFGSGHAAMGRDGNAEFNVYSMERD